MIFGRVISPLLEGFNFWMYSIEEPVQKQFDRRDETEKEAVSDVCRQHKHP